MWLITVSLWCCWSGSAKVNTSKWKKFIKSKWFVNKQWVRLNYAATHHDPPRSTTSQNISGTTHHQPKYIHHHPAPAKIYPPPPTISQKMNYHHAKAKIYSYIVSFWHCFNSFFFFEMQYCFPWRRFCVIKFWSVRFSSSKFLLTFRSSHRRCSARIGVLRKFAIHRKTPVSQSLFR